MARSIANQTALITGGAKRIGRETALALAVEGCNIVIHHRHSRDEADNLCAELRGLGVHAWSIQADFDLDTEVETLFERALELAGTVDILINNASIFPLDSLETMRFDNLVANLRVNAWAPLYLGRALFRHGRPGSIINLLDSSLRGYDWKHASYMVSKQSLELITRMMALEFAPRVTVNAVAPGLILPPPGRPTSYIERMKDTVPLKKHGDPRAIAEAIVYLVKSDFLTGETIYVDGGRHLQEYGGGVHPH